MDIAVENSTEDSSSQSLCVPGKRGGNSINLN